MYGDVAISQTPYLVFKLKIPNLNMQQQSSLKTLFVLSQLLLHHVQFQSRRLNENLKQILSCVLSGLLFRRTHYTHCHVHFKLSAMS